MDAVLYAGFYWGSAFVFTSFLLSCYGGDCAPVVLRPRSNRSFFSSRIVGFLHALTCTYYTFCIYETPSEQWTLHNTSLQTAAMANSMGYFLYDLVYLLAFEWSAVFVAHHVGLLAVLGVSCALHINGFSTMILMGTAEMINPVYQILNILRKARYTYAHNALFVVNTFLFFVNRILVMPFLMGVHMVWGFYTTEYMVASVAQAVVAVTMVGVWGYWFWQMLVRLWSLPRQTDQWHAYLASDEDE